MSINGQFGDVIREKFNYLIKKNVGFAVLKSINFSIKGEQNENVDFTPDQISCFKYAPITSCDVERSFSKYKFMFNQRKHRILFENFTKSLIINCNSDNWKYIIKWIFDEFLLHKYAHILQFFINKMLDSGYHIIDNTLLITLDKKNMIIKGNNT